VWLFIAAPLVGSLIAVALWKLTRVEDAAEEVIELRGDMDTSESRDAATV
jgi:hypothetical protein